MARPFAFRRLKQIDKASALRTLERLAQIVQEEAHTSSNQNYGDRGCLQVAVTMMSALQPQTEMDDDGDGQQQQAFHHFFGIRLLFSELRTIFGLVTISLSFT